MIDKAFNKKRLPFPFLGAFDMDQLVQGSKPAVAPPTPTSAAPGLDPTAARILQHLMPDRSQSGQARDQAEADKIRADSFGGRAGGFASTKESYHDDPSLPMAQRMEAFHNRTTREGQQTLGNDQVVARAKAGLGTNIGTPSVPFDVNRMVRVPSGRPDSMADDKYGYDTTGLPSGHMYPKGEAGAYEVMPNQGGKVPNTGFSGNSQYGTASVSFPDQPIDMSKLTHGQQSHQPTGGMPSDSTVAAENVGNSPSRGNLITNGTANPTSTPQTPKAPISFDMTGTPQGQTSQLHSFWDWLAKHVSGQGQPQVPGLGNL